jgi:hypothetical protein
MRAGAGGPGGGRPHLDGAEAIERFAELARDNLGRPRRSQLEDGLRQLSARLEAPRRRRRLLGGVFAAVAVSACAWFWASRDVPSPLTTPSSMAYRVAGGVVLEGGYLRETGASAMTLAFSDGSRVIFQPGGRGRVRNVGVAGARLSLEHGTAELALAAGAGDAWRLDAGPFVVKATGTAMTVSWDIAAERFELKIRRGHVAVSGPVTGDLTLEAGHRLRVDLGRGETLIDELDHERPSAPDSSEAFLSRPLKRAASGPAVAMRQPARKGSPLRRTKPRLDDVAAPVPSPVPPSRMPPAPPVRSSPPSSEPPSASVPSSPSMNPSPSWWWADALAKGKVDEILADAARRGRAAALEESPTDELFALADAARYRRRLSLARDALMAARRRFPSSPRSLDAVYLLGRVEELAAGGAAAALGWYDAYLKLAPTGTYASEALGRKMILIRDTRGPAEAQALAELYLRRFPSGSYRGAAEALQRAP